jgi:hypothetical protein
MISRVQPEAVQRTYIENNRYIRDIRCFLTLSFENRKLYVDKTTKEDNDYKQRFLCDDADDPFGILEILRVQKKPDDLYKYLDGFTLKQRLGIPEGILAIKKIHHRYKLEKMAYRYFKWTNFSFVTKSKNKNHRYPKIWNAGS